jgi:hypothetical protein
LGTQGQETSQRANLEPSDQSLAPVVAGHDRLRTTAALGFLQMIFVAMFFGPALYLIAAGAIRWLIGAGDPLPSYASLNEPIPHALLPPRLEPSESAVQS